MGFAPVQSTEKIIVWERAVKCYDSRTILGITVVYYTHTQKKTKHYIQNSEGNGGVLEENGYATCLKWPASHLPGS